MHNLLVLPSGRRLHLNMPAYRFAAFTQSHNQNNFMWSKDSLGNTLPGTGSLGVGIFSL